MMTFSRVSRGVFSLAAAALLVVPAFSDALAADKPAEKPATKQAAKPTTKPATKPATKKAGKQTKADETPFQIEKKLIAFGTTHLARANTTVRPNKANPEVQARDGAFVATYVEIDTASLSTEMTPSNTPGCLYVGHVLYHERVFESVAVSKAEATKGPYKHTKTRRIRELTRYDAGKWHY